MISPCAHERSTIVVDLTVLGSRTMCLWCQKCGSYVNQVDGKLRRPWTQPGDHDLEDKLIMDLCAALRQTAGVVNLLMLTVTLPPAKLEAFQQLSAQCEAVLERAGPLGAPFAKVEQELNS